MDTAQRSLITLIDLLDLEYVFSQNRLLTVDKFRDACEDRGLSLPAGRADETLATLHRADILVPLYRVAKDTRALRRAARQQGIPLWTALSQSSLFGQRLYESHADGRVYDPRNEPFVLWHRHTRMIGELRVKFSEFTYSPYQLLLIPNMQRAIEALCWERRSTSSHRARLVLSEFVLTRLRNDRQHNDELIIALSALDRIYRPHITGITSLPALGNRGEAERDAFEQHFAPTQILRWLDWNPDRVREEAERLLRIAKSIDPLAEWLPLIRLSRPEKWERLRGNALVAMDHRIAAEILLLFYEDLVKADAAPPFPDIPRFASHPLRERIKASEDELDGVLMDFGLSPHPSLVLFLEGETEMDIVPKVITQLQMRWPRNFIEIHNGHGTQANIGRLASYIAPLTFGETHGDFVELTRPATRFLAVFDRENIFENDESTETARQKWIAELFNAVPLEYRLDALRDTLNSQIDIVIWDDGSFEFAHFSDAELKDAISAACSRLNIPIKAIEDWKIQDARTRKRSIETVFAGKAKNRLTKPELAKELFIILERKIQRAIETNMLDSIPILRVLKKALDHAVSVHRSDVGVPLQSNSNPTTS